MGGAAAIQADDLARSFGRSTALRSCTFSVPVGATVALVGANGAGKTTLLRLTAGLLQPTSGQLRVLGCSPSVEDEHFLSRIGLLPQDLPVYPHLSVHDMLRVGAALNRDWDSHIAADVVDRIHVDSRQKAGTLSVGQRAQLLLGIVLAKRRAELLLLDEPSAALDPLARDDFWSLLQHLRSRRASTCIISSHSLDELAAVCDHLVVLRLGRVVFQGPIDDAGRGNLKQTVLALLRGDDDVVA